MDTKMKTLLGIAAGVLMAASLQAQARTVKLTWADATNPAGTTYSIKRATGLCTGTPVFSTLATGIALKSYDDTTVTVGNYAYVATATFSGIESGPSNCFQLTVPPGAPSSLNGTLN
jgi:hypothetical protein